MEYAHRVGCCLSPPVPHEIPENPSPPNSYGSSVFNLGGRGGCVCSGCFPFLPSSIPPGMSTSIVTDMLWMAKDWNWFSGVCVYVCDGDGEGDKMARSVSTSCASS